jgi:nucleoid-associated protein YgaU
MGNFEKLGVLVIIILAVVIMIILIGGGPEAPLEPERGELPTQLEHHTARGPDRAGGGGLSAEPPDRQPEIVIPPEPVWPPAPSGTGRRTGDETPAPQPEPDPPAPEPVEDLTHEVQRNETLYRIAKLYFGDGKYWKEIVQANPGLDATSLSIGQQIRIPRPERVLGDSASSGRPAAAPASSGEVYVVKKGDSLWRIAEKTLGSGPAFTQIRDANLDVLGPNGTDLTPGMRLRIPR